MFVYLILPLYMYSGLYAAEIEAFYYLDATPEQTDYEAVGVRQWPILMNAGLRNLAEGDLFVFRAPSGKKVVAEISQMKMAANNDVMLQANFGATGLAVLTIGDEAVFGSFINAEFNFSIGHNAHGQTILVDTTSIPNRASMLDSDERISMSKGADNRQKSQALMSHLKSMNAQSSGKTNIDILFVHSVRFGTVFANPQTRVNQLISFTNAAFDRSGILIELRVVGVAEIDFDNELRVTDTLAAATDGSGDFANVDALRNEVGADMVAVLHGNPGFSAQGVAWVNGDNADLAFSSTRLSPGCCDSVFTHELGHNLGSGHERESVNSGAGSPCNGSLAFTDYACGYGNAANGWGTIMSRLDDAAVGFRFSNLDVACQGEACGIAQGQTNAADNRASFNMSRFLVANFRAEVNPPDPGPNPSPSPSPKGPGRVIPIYLLLLVED